MLLIKNENIQSEFLILKMQDKIAKQEDVYKRNVNSKRLLQHYAFLKCTLISGGTIMGYGSSPYDFRDSSKKMVSDCSLAKLYYEKAFRSQNQ